MFLFNKRVKIIPQGSSRVKRRKNSKLDRGLNFFPLLLNNIEK